jgi:hypothetical protein
MASAAGTARAGDLPARAGEDELAWERRQATPTAIAAFVAAICLLLGQILPSRVFGDFPTVGVLDGVRDALGQPLSGGQTGLRSAQVIYYADHGTAFVLISLLIAIGYLGTGLVLAYLWRAVKHRNPAFARWALIVALVGPVLYAVAVVVAQIGIVSAASDFKSASDQSSQAARDALQGGLASAAQALQLLGAFGTAIALILIPLNAMRVGLLTRFLGILGIIAGVLVIFRLGGPIVQCYWLVAIGLIVLDKWPGAGGRPPAWAAGEAMPWPTQQELREQRQATTAATPDPTPVASTDDDVAPAARARTSRKRKRK